MKDIRLIVGLANPGEKYAQTRHNAGAWYIMELARLAGASLVEDKKMFGLTARVTLYGQDVRLLIPTEFMNCSGKSVAAIAHFYRIAPEQMLIAHDELDLPPGIARFKQGGGHGGHNGLRDIIACLGNENSFKRLRIGIDHPGDASQVTNYVLKAPLTNQKELIKKSFQNAMKSLPMLFDNNWDAALLDLHTKNKAL